MDRIKLLALLRKLEKLRVNDVDPIIKALYEKGATAEAESLGEVKDALGQLVLDGWEAID